MRILFAGTPYVATESLRAINKEFEVAAILTRPDAQQGRGRAIRQNPVKATGEELHIPVWTDNPSTPEFAQKMIDHKIDIGVVVAYGRILKKHVLDALPLGWYNLHFSMLPQWRGAAPVQRSIWTGDRNTGISIFKLTPGLDDGDIAFQESAIIEKTDTSGTLMATLGKMGSKALVHVLHQIENNTLVLTPQEGEVTEDHQMAKKITIDEAHVNPQLEATVLDCHIRASTPAPGAWCIIKEMDEKWQPINQEQDVNSEISTNEDEGKCKSANLRIRVDTAVEVSLEDNATGGNERDKVLKQYYENHAQEIDSIPQGALIQSKNHIWLKCGDNSQGKITYLELLRITPPGKKTMEAAAWLRGAHLSKYLMCC